MTMETMAPFGVAIAISGAVACVWWLFLRRRPGFSVPALAVGISGMLATPLLVPAEAPVGRMLAAVVALVLACKMVDFHRYAHKAPSPGLADYLRFLANPMIMTFDRRPPPVKRPPGPEAVRIASSLVLLGTGTACLALMYSSDFGTSSFLLDHTVKVLLLAMIIEGGSQFALGVARIVGTHAVPVSDLPILSRTPAEFWRRYNRMVGAWLFRHVFLPAGGRRRPILAVSLTFLTSGILHEYLFDIAAWEAKGLLLAFFAIQGLGVLMSPALERAAKSLGTAGSILARLFTILFVISSTVLFFSALDRICPGFYSADLFLP